MTDKPPSDLSPASEQPDRSGRNMLRKRLIGIAQVVLSFAVLIWLINKVGIQNLLDTFASLDPWLYGLAFIVLIASIAARALRWQVLLTPLGVQVPFRELFSLYMIGFFWNSFLPTGFGGDVVKAVELHRTRKGGAAAVTSVVAERVVGLFTTCLIGVLVIPIWPQLFPPEAIVFVLALCISIVVGVWLLRLNFLAWIEARAPFMKRITSSKKIVSLHRTLQAYSWKALWLGMLTSIPFTLLSVLDSYLVGLAMGIKLPIGIYALYTPIITAINLLPLSFNGIGVREYTYQVLFGMVGIAAAQAVAMALAFNLLRTLAGLLGGVFSLVTGIKRSLAPGEAQAQ
jgi:glycosyltransferase 2 family protein